MRTNEMAGGKELLPCPGGCGKQVHASAVECPECGYRSHLSRVEDLLVSLGTISSILVGFGLAALVQLATDEPKDVGQGVLNATAACWILGSLLLLAVMIGAEVLRRREVSGGRMHPSRQEDERLWGQTEWLLVSFAIALLCTAAGVVLLGFFFSWWHGCMGLAGCAVACLIVWKGAFR
jgi:hypothetical protein